MKFLAFAAVATAFAIPDARLYSQLVLADDSKAPAGGAPSLHDAVDAIKAGVDKGLDAVNDWLRDGLSRASEAVSFDTDSELGASGDDDDDDAAGFPLLDPAGKGKASNLTIYQLIAGSNYTTQFAALVDQFPAVVAMLNSTAANYTLFVPADAAFAKLPGGALNETRPAALERLVRYHIGLDAFSYKVMYNARTIASAYDEPLLGGAPQRLRVRFEKSLGLRVNFYSRVVSPNFVAANGVVHAVDTVLAPPAVVGRALALVPAHYSTLLLAMAQTNFSETVDRQARNGSTVFAPSNTAFAKLGAEINTFLFSTPRGLKYLEALLRYTVVPNATVYSDAYYGPPLDDAAAAAAAEAEAEAAAASDSTGGLVQYHHYQLPTLLGNTTVSVNVTAVPGYSVVLVNNVVRVAVQDSVAKNGVLHEVGTVPFPPALDAPVPGNPWKDVPVTTVADLIARLGPYVDDDAADSDVPAVPVSEL